MLIKAFKNPQVLDPEAHKNLKVAMRLDMMPFREVEFVPLGYSEIVACTMYYPVFFGLLDSQLMPIAMVGMNSKSIFLKEDGGWKVDVVPQALELYPFGVHGDKDDYLVVLDMAYAREEGSALFDEEGNPTEYLSKVVERLTNYARDLEASKDLCKEVMELGLLEAINLTLENKYGKYEIKGMLLLKPEKLRALQPEKMYLLNSKGYLFTLHAHYLSLRNFKLFDLI